MKNPYRTPVPCALQAIDNSLSKIAHQGTEQGPVKHVDAASVESVLARDHQGTGLNSFTLYVGYPGARAQSYGYVHQGEDALFSPFPRPLCATPHGMSRSGRFAWLDTGAGNIEYGKSSPGSLASEDGDAGGVFSTQYSMPHVALLRDLQADDGISTERERSDGDDSNSDVDVDVKEEKQGKEEKIRSDIGREATRLKGTNHTQFGKSQKTSRQGPSSPVRSAAHSSHSLARFVARVASVAHLTACTFLAPPLWHHHLPDFRDVPVVPGLQQTLSAHRNAFAAQGYRSKQHARDESEGQGEGGAALRVVVVHGSDFVEPWRDRKLVLDRVWQPIWDALRGLGPSRTGRAQGEPPDELTVRPSEVLLFSRLFLFFIFFKFFYQFLFFFLSISLQPLFLPLHFPSFSFRPLHFLFIFNFPHSHSPVLSSPDVGPLQVAVTHVSLEECEVP